MSQFPRSAAHPTQAQAALNAQIDGVQAKLLHALDLIADKYVERYTSAAEPEETAEVRRRAMANALQIWRRCPQNTCRRTRACRGEPAHCLDACMPGLPPGTIAAYVASTRRRCQPRQTRR